ncbi:hypothetical protein ACFQJ8_22170 [Halocatena marina]|uniref:hypothetical protein n=1 Tax=Halocatena marina TaxID=2934937 RepID=UPI00362047FD
MSYADDGQFPEVVLTYLLKPNRWSRDRDGSDDGILVEIGAATDETYSKIGAGTGFVLLLRLPIGMKFL